MPLVKVLLIVVLAYVGFVAVMEALIGYIQPHMDGGIALVTTDAEGTTSERNLAVVNLDGKLYIGSNHWLRGWYHQALANPNVLVTVEGAEEAPFSAVPIEGEERARVADVYRMGFVLRFICGFAPSKFLRLDPA